MSILFCASEVGSVRALLPVCYELINQGHSISIDRHGFFKEVNDTAISDCFVDIPQSTSDINDFLANNKYKTLIFSVNVHDIHPLRVARAALLNEIITLHVLDYWNGYRSRLELDGKPCFKPTKYLVPDNYAQQQAIKEGIDSDSIVISGQAAFAETQIEYLSAQKKPPPFKDNFYNSFENIILFVCEPVALDQGESLEENPAYRGYVERDTLSILINALSNLPIKTAVCILPHPRQDPSELAQLWSSLGGDKYGKIDANYRGRDLLPFVDGVSGMASTLLYEAWLVGKPVLSIQPNLLNNSLRMLQQKNGVTFIDQEVNAVSQTKEWLITLDKTITQTSQSELMCHINAPTLIANIATHCINEV